MVFHRLIRNPASRRGARQLASPGCQAVTFETAKKPTVDEWSDIISLFLTYQASPKG
jgi:hypothetical protein